MQVNEKAQDISKPKNSMKAPHTVAPVIELKHKPQTMEA